MLDIMTKRYGFSLRGTMSELRYGRDSRKAASPKRVPSKSLPRKLPKRAPVDLPGGLIPFAAGKAAYGPFSADSTHRRFNRYVPAKHAKGGKWVADTRKRHVLVSPDGRAPAWWRPTGAALAPPRLRRPAQRCPTEAAPHREQRLLPPTNCEAAKGRDPYFEPKKNHASNRAAAVAKMVKSWKERPGLFCRTCKAGTATGAAFSATKGRFAYCVRSVTIPMQERELAIAPICRNAGARRFLESKDHAALPQNSGGCRAPPADRARSGRFRTVSAPDTAGTRARQTSKRHFPDPRGPLGGRLPAILAIV